MDVDVHPVPRSVEEIREFLAMPWRDRYRGERRGFFENPVHGSRLDSVPPDGGPKGSDPDFLRAQLIDEYGVAYAIMISRTFCGIHPDPDYAAAIAGAFNDWLAECWLGAATNHDGAFKGSITIAPRTYSCLGSVGGTLKPSPPGHYDYGHHNRILRCPWHGWEFDITTGKSLFNPHATRVRTYDVTVTPTPADRDVEAYEVSVRDGLVVLDL